MHFSERVYRRNSRIRVDIVLIPHSLPTYIAHEQPPSLSPPSAPCQMRLRAIASSKSGRHPKPSLLLRPLLCNYRLRKPWVYMVAVVTTAIITFLTYLPWLPSSDRERVAVCFGGNARTFRLNFTHQQIWKHIIDPLRRAHETDIFFVISLDDPPRGKLPVAPHDPNGTLSAVAKFEPKVIHVLDKRTDQLPVHRIRRIYRNHQPPIDVMQPPTSCIALGSNRSIRVAHTLLRARQCLDLITAHEARVGVKYDWVYRLRPDVVLLQDILLPRYLRRDTYYSNQGRTNVTAELGSWWASNHGYESNDGAVADQVAIMSRKVATVALRAFDASDDCQIYTAPFLPLPEEVLRFWLLKKGILYRALPFDWAIVRERMGLECSRLFHQFGSAPDGRRVDWRASIRNCLLVAHSVRDHFPDMPSLESELEKLNKSIRLPNEITTT